MPKTVTLRIDDALMQKLKQYAEIENRTISNFIETATLRYIEQNELVDEFEMAEILSNKDLLHRLNQGRSNAHKKKGRFV